MFLWQEFGLGSFNFHATYQETDPSDFISLSLRFVFLQTRIVLNKADIVKPEELMRVQSALIWNISPLMSSAQPPVMYTASLWSMPFEAGAPTRLLQAQERELLRDLRHAIDKRIENKIASARRFAVSHPNIQLPAILLISYKDFARSINKTLHSPAKTARRILYEYKWHGGSFH